MDFTEVFKQSHQLVEYSPNSFHIATAVGNRLVVREAASLQILSLFNCSEPIQGLAWSPCSHLILIFSLSLGVIQVFAIEEVRVEEALKNLLTIKLDSRRIRGCR
jgi:hypothetical protein